MTIGQSPIGGMAWSGYLRAGAQFSIKTFGAIMDGVTNDSSAIQASLDELGYAYIPKGTALIETPIIIPSEGRIFGEGMGVSIVKIGSGMALTDVAFSNANNPSAGTRSDSFIEFSNLTIDGVGREYPAYLDDPGGSDHSIVGYILQLKAVNNGKLDGVEIKNHESHCVYDQGGRNFTVSNCRFTNNGKIDWISSPIITKHWGTFRNVANITNAANAEVELQASATLSGGDSVKLVDTGMPEIPDGNYTIVSVVSATKFTINVDTSAADPYKPNVFTYVGWYNGTGSGFIANQNVSITGSHFYDNKRSAITLSTVGGGVVDGNTFENNKEATIFSENARRVVISNNLIKGCRMSDLLGSAIELNQVGGCVISGNHIEDTDSTAIASFGSQGLVIDGNVFVNIIKDNTKVIPTGPYSVAAGLAGTVMTDSKVIRLYSTSGGAGINSSSVVISNNSVSDYRTAPQASAIVTFGKTGVINAFQDIAIVNNNFAFSGVDPASMIEVFESDATTIPYKIRIAGNIGHSSEAPVVIQTAAPAPGNPGVVSYDVGFVPSAIHVMAYLVSTTAGNVAHSFIVRDRTNYSSGSQGHGYAQGVANSTQRVNELTNDFYNIVNAAGTVQAGAEFSAWLFNDTNIGFAVNYNSVGTQVNLTMMVYP